MLTNIKKIFLSNLSENITENDIISYFKIYCDILDCVIIIDKTTKQSLGYGFIIISNSDKVKEILNSQPHIIKGIEIECHEFFSENKLKFSKKNFDNKKNFHDINFQNKKIFIGGLPPQTTKNTLINFFKRYGEIEYCVINTDKYTDKPRGFGFIVFQSSLSVDYCLKDSNNHFILGKWVECKKANAKENNKKKFFEKNTYSTYENEFFINKQKMKLQNNLKSIMNSKYYPQPSYLNQGNFQQKNLFIYQDGENEKNKNYKNYKNYNNINNNKNIIKNCINNILVKANESPPKNFENFKNEFKSNSFITNINNENYINELETNSSSGNMNSNSNSNITGNSNKKNDKEDDFEKLKNEKEDEKVNEKEEEINIDSKNLNNYNKEYNQDIIPNYNNNNDFNLKNLISNQTKEMFQNYFNNALKNPKDYNYFHYKLFDVNGEEVSKLSSYQNISKVKLFKSDSDKDSDSNSNTNSNIRSNSEKKFSSYKNSSDSNSNNSDNNSDKSKKSNSEKSHCNSNSNHYSSSDNNKTPSQNSQNSKSNLSDNNNNNKLKTKKNSSHNLSKSFNNSIFIKIPNEN